MKEKLRFNPYIGPKPIFSIFQWGFGGYLGPCLIIYENGLVVKAVYVNPEDFFFEPKIMSTVISAEELNFLKNEILIQIDENVSEAKTKYFLAPGWKDVGEVEIISNISSLKKIEIQGCDIKNETVSYHKKNKYDCGIPDKIPNYLKKCLKFLCKYKFSDLKEYVPFYFKFELQGKKSEGETVNWPVDLPSLNTFHVEEYSEDFTFYIEGIYYKRVLEFYLSNQHKNIRFRDADREMFYYPKLIFPYEDLFYYND